MGVLGANGDRGTPAPEDQTPAPEGQEPNPGDQGDGRPRADDGTFVSAEALKPERGTRRNKTQEQIDEAMNARFKEYETRWTTERQQYEQRLTAADQRWQEAQQSTARLQGALDEMRARPAPVAASVAQGPDPEDLRREARKALQANDIDTYERNLALAARIEAKREAEGIFKPQLDAFKAEIEKRIPQQVPMEIQTLMLANRNVALAGQRGIAAVRLKDQELEFNGVQPGPQRMAKAFELADAMLATAQRGTARPAGYDQSAALALSGASTGGRGAPGGGGGDGGVQLSAVDVENARKAGMTPAEWVKWGDPFKHGMVKQ